MEQKKFKKRLGDRKDGRKLRTLEPMNVVVPFIMKERNDASNLFSDSIELSEIQKFVHEKRNNGMPGFNAMHVLIASYVRSIASNPGINRFVNGYRVYARNQIEVIMEVKKELALNAPGTMMKFIFMPDSTVDEIYKQMNEKIIAYKNSSDEPSSFDKVAKFLGLLPRWFFRFTVFMLKWLDYHGKLPRFLLNVSPFHGSLVITSMASLNIPPIYHHLYNFGNVPMFISFSTTRHVNEIDRDGVVHNNHYLDLKFTTDERICDGQYYASALHDVRKYLKNPVLLNNPPEKVIEDIY